MTAKITISKKNFTLYLVTSDPNILVQKIQIIMVILCILLPNPVISFQLSPNPIFPTPSTYDLSHFCHDCRFENKLFRRLKP